MNILMKNLLECYEENLNIAPIKFIGPEPNTIGNFVIAGHNNWNKSFFSNLNKLKEDDFELLENYYTEVGNEADEIVFWIGSPKPTIQLQLLFKCIDNLEDVMSRLINL